MFLFIYRYSITRLILALIFGVCGSDRKPIDGQAHHKNIVRDLSRTVWELSEATSSTMMATGYPAKNHSSFKKRVSYGFSSESMWS